MAFLGFMRDYFHGEKTEALLLLILGAIYIVVTLYLFFGTKQPFLRGLAPVVMIGGAVLVIAGSTVYLRTDKQVAQIEQSYHQNPQQLQASESARMTTVMHKFRLYIAVYLLLLILAAPLYYFAWSPFMKGIAVGMVIFGLTGMIVDHFAETRGEMYQISLQEIVPESH